MNAQALRMFFFRIHTWLGLNTCIVLGVMFATGTVLVFSTEIETAFYVNAKSGDLPRGEPLTYGQVFDTVQTAYPDVTIASIARTGADTFFGVRTQVRTAWGEKISIWTDPGTGEILGSSPAEGFHTILLSFHDSLFSGNWFGRTAVTVLAFSLLMSVVSGLIAYRRFWRGLKTLPPRGRGARPWWGGLHRMVAVWCLPFLLTVAVTGIYYFVAQMGVIPTKGPTIPPASERAGALPSGFNGSALDQAYAAARKAAPDQNVLSVFLPGRPNQGINFSGPSEDQIVNIATNLVVIDPQTMAVLAHVTPADFSPKNKAKHFFDPLHHGDWAGNYSRAAWLFFGAAGTLLMFSGAMVFASRIARMPPAGSINPQSGNATARIWRGMYLTKWVLVPLTIAVAGIGIYRYAWATDRWTTVDPVTMAGVPAKLSVKGSLRQGQPLQVRIQISGSAPDRMTVRLNKENPMEIPLKKGGKGGNGQFTFIPNDSRNEIILSLPNAGGADQQINWILGRPVL